MSISHLPKMHINQPNLNSFLVTAKAVGVVVVVIVGGCGGGVIVMVITAPNPPILQL